MLRPSALLRRKTDPHAVMTLYNLERCPYCKVVRDRLDALQISYEKIDVPPAHADRHAVRAVSGQPYVPVLVAGDVVLDDEEKILAWLDETYGEKIP